MFAPCSTASATTPAVPQARPSTDCLVNWPMNPFLDGPTNTGNPKVVNSAQMREEVKVVREDFTKSDARIKDNP